MVVPLQDDFLTQFAEVPAVQEVVGVHFVRAVRRTHRNRCLVGALGRVLNSHYVISQRVEHQEKENNSVKSRGPPQRRVRVREDCWDEEAEVQDEGDCCSHEEVRRRYSIEQSQF